MVQKQQLPAFPKIFQGGFAEWYKESLLKENFGDDSETVGNSKEGD